MKQRVVHAVATAAASSSGGSDLLGGADLLQLLVLAFGGALVVGNGLALVRSRSGSAPSTGRVAAGTGATSPQVGRCIVMIAIGLIASVWAIASLST